MDAFGQWNNLKKKIHKKDPHFIYFRVGEVWWCNVGMNVGVEQNGKGKAFSRRF